MSNIQNQSAISLTSEQFLIYGEYVNLHRHIPEVLDGLKPSYRRVIIAALNIARKNKVKTATLIGETIGKYHPHGDRSMNALVARLVNSKILSGRGNFGLKPLIGDKANPAAPRYTECGLSENYDHLLSPLLGYAPQFRNDLGFDEYKYLPVPIPLGLIFGYEGIGIGTNTRIPEFTPKSMLEAYKKDDPKLLKNYNGLIIENPDALVDLWKYGKGRIAYHINYYRQGDKVFVEGNPGFINPAFPKLMEWRNQGRVDFEDYSADEQKIAFFKMPRVQWPYIDEIEKDVIASVSAQKTYYIRVVCNDVVRDIGVKDWIDITYKNYCIILDKYKKDIIDKLKFDILVASNFKAIAEMILKDTSISDDTIISKLQVPREVVSAVTSKSISQLRNNNKEAEVAKLEAKIKEYNNFNNDKFIESVVDQM